MELFGVKTHHLEGSYLMTKNEVDRIIADAIWYIKNPLHKEKFGPIALGLYDLHRELNPVYKKYDKGPLTDWREIPLMPISEFKHNDVGLVMSDRMPFPGVEFHSSGTTQGDKSKHRMYDTEAYRAAIAHGFQKEITYKKNQAHIGQMYEILIEPTTQDNSPQNSVGRTDGNKLVILSQNGYKIGDVVKVKITDATPHALKGQPV